MSRRAMMLGVACLLLTATACLHLPGEGLGESQSVLYCPYAVDDSRTAYLGSVAAAHAHHRLGESAECRRWLNESPEEFRGWESQYLNALSDQSDAKIGHFNEAILELELSPDGRTLAAAFSDDSTSNPIRLFNTSDDKLIREWQGHTAGIYSVAFSDDGEQLVSAAGDARPRVWDVGTGRETAVFKGHKYPSGGAQFLGDDLAASCSYDRGPQGVQGVLRIWDAATGEEKGASTELEVKPLVAMAKSPDGKSLAIASWNFCVFVVDVETRALKHRLAFPDDGLYNAVDAVTYSPDGRFIAAGGRNKMAAVWNADSGELVATLKGHDGGVTAVAFDPKTILLATGAEDDTIRLWNTANWECQSVLRGHIADVRALAFSADGSNLYSGGIDQTIRRWSLDGAPFGELTMQDSGDTGVVEFSPDGSKLLTCTFDGNVGLWDSRTGKRIAEWNAHPGNSCNTAAFSPDGSKIATCSWSGEVRIWDASSQELLHTLSHEHGVSFIAFHPDGKRLAAAPANRTITLWNVENGKILDTLKDHAANIESIAFSPDGNYLASAGGDGNTGLWKFGITKQFVLLEDEHAGGCQSVAFSADSTLLATGGADGGVMVRAVPSGAIHRSVIVSDDAISRLSWLPDGSRIAASTGRVTKILDIPLLDTTLTIGGHDESLWSIDFSPDGTRLATSSMDGRILIHDARTRAER